jgi:hypothetical protein
MDEKIFFELQIAANLDGYYSSAEKSPNTHEAELTIDTEDNYKIQLRITCDFREQLIRKLFKYFEQNGFSLNKFQVTKIINPESLIGVDFLNYKCTLISESDIQNEDGLKYCTLDLTGVRKKYEYSEIKPSEVYLNEQAFELVEMNYKYKTRFPWTETEYDWKPINKIEDFSEFGNVQFKPEHRFEAITKNSVEKVSIKKTPRLAIKHPLNEESEIKKHIELICSLYSFYATETIDYFASRIYTTEGLYVEIRNVSNSRLKDIHGLFARELHLNPMNLFAHLEAEKLFDNLDFFKKIVERFIYANKTTGESKFMILYSVLEQVRNMYIIEGGIETGDNGVVNPEKVIERYNFKGTRGEINACIKAKLESITEIVAIEHKGQFASDIPNKLNQIKQMTMANQLQSLFDYVNIEPSTFNLDMSRLLALRNAVFHGSTSIDDLEELNEINSYKCLPKLVGTVMLKYAGINDVDHIPRIPPV